MISEKFSLVSTTGVSVEQNGEYVYWCKGLKDSTDRISIQHWNGRERVMLKASRITLILPSIFTFFILKVMALGIPMHARMIHSHNGNTIPIPYGKKGQVRTEVYVCLTLWHLRVTSI